MKQGKGFFRRMMAVGFWLAVWQAAAMAIGQEVFLVSPVQALRCLLRLLPQADFWHRVGFSAGRILLGFGLGVVCSASLAVAAEICSAAEILIAPVLQLVKATPVASFIILALVWLNSQSLSLFISALMVFPPVYLNVLEGICRTDRRLLEMARVFRVPFGRRLRGIYLPQVMPYFRTAVSLGLGLCWKAGAAAEIIGLPAGSMGERLYTAKVYFQTADLFAWTVTIVAVSVAFERLFLALVDRLMGKAGL